MGTHLYLIGIAFLVVALVIGRGRRNSFKARDVSNSVVITGDVSGTVTHTVSQPTRSLPTRPGPDRIAWIIGIVGVLVASAQLLYDLLQK
jgi:hypothetical protein